MLEGLKEETPQELIFAVIIEKTHWTYQEIMAQPQWLIQTLLLKWKIDGEQQNKTA